MELVTLRLIFGGSAHIFLLATLLSVIFALHVRDTMPWWGWSGSAIGAVLAGDFLTLFGVLGSNAIASVFLVWATRTPGPIGLVLALSSS